MDFREQLEREINNVKCKRVSSEIEMADVERRKLVLETRMENYTFTIATLQDLLSDFDEEFEDK